MSLSTITGETSTAAPPPQAIPVNPGGVRDSSPYGYPPNPYGPPPTSGTFVAADQPRDFSGQYPQGFGESGLGELTTSSPSPRPPPAVLPPSGGQ